MKRNIYITDQTDARLAAFGGANRAENLRRAVALAEVAGELAEALECYAELEHIEGEGANRAQNALEIYRSAKQ